MATHKADYNALLVTLQMDFPLLMIPESEMIYTT